MKPYFQEKQWLSWIDKLAQDHFVVINNFLSPQLFETLCAYFKAINQNQILQPAKIGSAIHAQRMSEIRTDYTHWIDKQRDHCLTPFFELVEECMAKLNRYCFLSLSGFEFHFAKYPKSAFYKAHLDRFKDNNNRVISMVIYLNPNWKLGDGGELRIHQNQSHLDVDPVACKAVLFKSDIVLHEVLPANKDRISLTGWLLHQPSSVGSIIY